MPFLADRLTALLDGHYWTQNPAQKNQKFSFDMFPEEDKTKPLTYKMEVKLVIVDPSQWLRWPSDLGKVKVTYYTETQSFDPKELDSTHDLHANRMKFGDDIDNIQWQNWFLILIELEYDKVKAIAESLADTYTGIPAETGHEHIERMRKAHFLIKLKRDPDIGVSGEDGSIYCARIQDDDWPPVQYDYSNRSESPNGVNGHR